MTDTPVITVAVIEDEKEIRLGLSYILEHTDGFRCTAAYRTYEDAFAFMKNPPDILLSDIGLPGMSGVDGARKFKEQYPKTSIIMLTVYSDDEKIFQSICAGASGYLLKKATPAKILEAIRDVHEGGASMSSSIALRVMKAFRLLTPRKHTETGLTRREEEILDELVKGNSYKSTADHLNISIHTVRFHIRSIYEKLQVHSKSEAVAKALQENLLR